MLPKSARRGTKKKCVIEARAGETFMEYKPKLAADHAVQASPLRLGTQLPLPRPRRQGS
ncbi:hypothetical protein J2S76_001742 [Ancylobacter vacuolatus]|uniref:Uncharacterized protein n=1 Tax=Ancylobacter vacuolatus TaxID=223389 RepID=A0ABU0DFW0_9HYPH|nr:hypothetical protein [Ancylobacter vacuolatus]